MGMIGFDGALIACVHVEDAEKTRKNSSAKSNANASAQGVRSPFASVNGMSLAFA